MPTQVELLKKLRDALAAERGPDAPFVRALEQQIRNAEKPQAENPVVHRMHVGMRGSTGKPQR